MAGFTSTGFTSTGFTTAVDVVPDSGSLEYISPDAKLEYKGKVELLDWQSPDVSLDYKADV